MKHHLNHITVMYKGFLTGLVLQFAIGPVFFYFVNIALHQNLINTFAAVIAVTLVDYVYISLAIIGIGAIFRQDRWKRVFGNISAIVLIGFGVWLVKGAFDQLRITANFQELSFLNTFLGAFFLTVSSPVTIIFWMSVFASKSIELNLTRRQTVLFGAGSGMATLVFLGAVGILINLINRSIPEMVAYYANVLIGILLVIYGIVRILKINPIPFRVALNRH